MNDILCKCGHVESLHPVEGYHRYQFERKYIVCDGCFNQHRIKGVLQIGTTDCQKYIPDNLMHIEVLAKERGLV